MRFLVDESTGFAVVEFLRGAGHDVLSIGESTAQATDVAILKLSENEDRILITNDKDFGELIFRRGQTHHGALLLRLRDERAANKVHVVRSVLDNYADRLPGNFVVATEKEVRIRAAK